jgi:GTP-binding protein Era
MHKSGFVNIIGFPNVGKSTILNALLGEKLVIVNPKAQTTRQRIFGIYNDDETQIVFSDTPGYIKDPKYTLQETMNTSVNDTFKDSDVVMYITEPEIRDLGYLGEKLKSINRPLIIIINKADLSNVEKLNEFAEFLDKELSPKRIITTSALHKFNIESIIPIIKEYLPEHPPYFDKDELSDRNVRFFISEIIRENILTYYSREIPYSSEVVVEEFKEDEKIT